MRIDGFDWDAGKWQKHGVAITEIEALFRRSVAVYADPGHSLAEQRLRSDRAHICRPRPDRGVHATAEGRR